MIKKIGGWIAPVRPEHSAVNDRLSSRYQAFCVFTTPIICAEASNENVKATFHGDHDNQCLFLNTRDGCVSAEPWNRAMCVQSTRHSAEHKSFVLIVSELSCHQENN